MSISTSVRALLSMLLMLGALHAHADDFVGFYAGLGLGPAKLNGRGVETDDTGYKVFAGYTFGESDDELLSLELAYIDGGSTQEVGSFFDWTNPPMQRTLSTFRKVETYAVNLSFVGMKPLTRSLGVFAKVGYAYADFEVTQMSQSLRGGVVSSPQHVSSDDFSYGGGLAFSFGKAFMARAEYEGFDLESGRLSFISLSGIYRF